MSDIKRVMVVDDSPVFRALLSEIINSDPLLEVVAVAEDPYQARELIKLHNPDVLTLDIEMPRMNGVQFLKNLMRLRPMPVVMISTLTQHGAEVTLQALELGAVDYFPKPTLNNPAEMVAYRDLVNDKVRLAAGANVRWDHRREQHAIEPWVDSSHSCQVIAIGASTGGTEAVRNVLAALPKGLPPVVITQHISALFSGPFATRLDSFSELKVIEVTEGPHLLEQSCAYVAPGDRHLSVFARDGNLYATPDEGPAVNRHKPSVDVMFDSVAEAAGRHAIAALLTGMGNDGASGMLRLRKQGAVTLAQDENTSVVWGMPRVAVELGAARTVAPLGRIPALICEALKQDSVVS